MTCDYCGHSLPVPDVERRKKQLARRERQRQKAEARQRQREQKEAQRKAECKKATRSRVGSWVRRLVSTLLGLLVPAVIIGAILYYTDVLNAFWGDTGESALAQATAPLIASGYKPQGKAHKARFFTGTIRFYLDMEQPGCYALAVGASTRLSKVQIQRIASQSPNRLGASIPFCIDRDKSVPGQISLDGPGQIAWRLFKAKAPPPQEQQATPTVRFRGRCSVRRSPYRRSPRIGYAKRGRPYPLLETRGHWRRIRLTEQLEGWAGCKDLMP